MALKSLYDVMTVARDRVVIAGSFAPAGTGAVTDVKGVGFSVARSGVGVFTITFDRTYPDLECAIVSTQLATPTGDVTNVGDYSAANGTLVLDHWDISGGAAADIAANANNRINFLCVFKNTSGLP